MNAADLVNGQGRGVFGIALGEPFEAVLESDDFESLVDALNGRCCNDAVNARSRTAADQYAQSSAFCSVCHGSM